MSVNRKAVVIYGSTDLCIYWDKADKLRLFYRDISHNLCEKRVHPSGVGITLFTLIHDPINGNPDIIVLYQAGDNTLDQY